MSNIIRDKFREIKEYVNSRMQFAVLLSVHSSVLDSIKKSIASLSKSKQDKLTAGKNITIQNNVISSTSEGKTYQPGTNIVIDGDVISANGYYYDENNQSFREGFNGSASGPYSHAEGSSYAAGSYSHAEGQDTYAYSQASHTEGSGSQASGYASHAEGSSYAAGSYSHAEGGGYGYGDYSHAESQGYASGSYSHAEGQNTTASGNASHSEGYSTTTGGDYSHAEGYYTKANANGDHAEGQNTTASGNYSHAEGNGTTASCYGSHAEGIATQATHEAEHAEGKCNKSNSVEIPTPIEYVDMGTSVLWAKWNLGASSETEYGDYYAWGETEPKNEYTWANYKWWTDGNNLTLTKYNSTDGKTVLDPEDDAAHVNLGGGWRMPTQAEMQELIDNCTYTWETDYQGSGVNGRLFTAQNGNTLFILNSGYYNSTGLSGRNSGYLNSSTLRSDFVLNCRLYSYFGAVTTADGIQRYTGLPVRPVISTSDLPKTNTIHSTGIGTSVNDRKNAFEIMDNGDVYVIGIGGYDGTNPEQAKTLQQVIEDMTTREIVVDNSTLSQQLEPNVMYIFNDRTSNLTLTLGDAIPGKVSEYHFIMNIGDTVPTITWPSGITWPAGSPEDAGLIIYNTLEVSIIHGVAMYVLY